MDLQKITEAVTDIEELTKKLRQACTSLTAQPTPQNLHEIQQWMNSANNSISLTNHSIVLMDQDASNNQNYVTAKIAFGAAVANYIAAEQEMVSKLPSTGNMIGVTIPEPHNQATNAAFDAPPPPYAVVMGEAPIAQQPTAALPSAPAPAPAPIVETRTIYVRENREEDCQPWIRCTLWRIIFYAVVCIAAIIVLAVGTTSSDRNKRETSPYISHMDEWSANYFKNIKLPDFDHDIFNKVGSHKI